MDGWIDRDLKVLIDELIQPPFYRYFSKYHVLRNIFLLKAVRQCVFFLGLRMLHLRKCDHLTFT